MKSVASGLYAAVAAIIFVIAVTVMFSELTELNRADGIFNETVEELRGAAPEPREASAGSTSSGIFLQLIDVGLPYYIVVDGVLMGQGEYAGGVYSEDVPWYEDSHYEKTLVYNGDGVLVGVIYTSVG